MKKTLRMRRHAPIAASVSLLLGVFATTLNCVAQSLGDVRMPKTPLVLKAVGSFFVDGKTVKQSDIELSSIFDRPVDGGGHLVIQQMYVQYMIPMSVIGPPVVMLHGATLTAKTYETTPDGRMGWEEYFVRHGRAVYLPDQVFRGRSGVDIATYNNVRKGILPPSALPNAFRHSNELNWHIFRFGPRPGTPFPDEQFPVGYADELAKQAVPDFNAQLPRPNPTYKALADLAFELHGAVLMGHSESGTFPLEAALEDIRGIRGLILVEPGLCGFPAYTPKQIAALSAVPILVIFGDHLDSPTGLPPFAWTNALASCKRFVANINGDGGKATMMYLPAMGIHGNSHMLMMDKNNLQIAGLILKWMGQNIGGTGHAGH